MRRPIEVQSAIAILVVNALLAIYQFTMASPGSPPIVGVVVGSAVIVGVLLFACSKLAEGSNRARLAVAGLLGLGLIVSAIESLSSAEPVSPPTRGINLQALGNAAIVILLFLPRSNAWFRAAGRARPNNTFEPTG